MIQIWIYKRKRTAKAVRLFCYFIPSGIAKFLRIKINLCFAKVREFHTAFCITLPDATFSTLCSAITLGVCKVNFATELRVAYTDAARKIIADEAVYDPKKYGAAARENVIELVRHRMRICSK